MQTVMGFGCKKCTKNIRISSLQELCSSRCRLGLCTRQMHEGAQDEWEEGDWGKDQTLLGEGASIRRSRSLVVGRATAGRAGKRASPQ